MDFCWKSLRRLILNFSFKFQNQDIWGTFLKFILPSPSFTIILPALRSFLVELLQSPLSSDCTALVSTLPGVISNTKILSYKNVNKSHIFPLILDSGEVKNVLIVMAPKWTGNSIRFVSNLFELKINRLLKQFFQLFNTEQTVCRERICAVSILLPAQCHKDVLLFCGNRISE